MTQNEQEITIKAPAPRQAPWFGVGTAVRNAMTSQQALVQGGLDWTVEKRTVMIDNDPMKEFIGLKRMDNGHVLSIVSPKYVPVQNREAFSFTDTLLGGKDILYENAGSFRGGKRNFLLARMTESMYVAGEKIEPYLVFSNSFDGNSGIKVALTPIRVVCQNTLTLALATAQRTWTAKHTGDITKKVEEARKTLMLATHYLEEFPVVAESMIQTNLTKIEVDTFLGKLFPEKVKEDPQAMSNRDALLAVYNGTADIQKFAGTAWGMYQAVTDYVGHSEPGRKTATYDVNRMFSLVDGNPTILTAQRLLQAIKA